MLDPKLLRNELDQVSVKLKKRGLTLETDRIQALEQQRKTIEVKTQELQNTRNTSAKAIGKAKANGEDVAPLLAAVSDLKAQLETSKDELDQIQQQMNTIAYTIPNVPHESVPEGTKEEDNQLVRTWGEPTEFDFTVKDHIELGEGLGQMDFAAAVKITGARFVVMHDGLAHLHRALGQFMLDIHTRVHGYQEVYVPYIVNKKSLYGTGQLPKFETDQFNIDGDWNYSLIPTAEVPLTNLVQNEIVDANDLPLKFVTQTPCFRSEAGSYGKDTKGMIRQHQFEKVELVQIVKPEESYEKLEELTGHAEAILQALELPYRVMTLCGGDLGFSAAKTYDLEVWLPGQTRYREISSCSNFESFQARRLSARWRDPNAKKTSYVHTINGSGLAIGRTLVAILENYQDKDGQIAMPSALQPYLNGATKLTKGGLQ